MIQCVSCGGQSVCSFYTHHTIRQNSYYIVHCGISKHPFLAELFHLIGVRVSFHLFFLTWDCSDINWKVLQLKMILRLLHKHQPSSQAVNMTSFKNYWSSIFTFTVLAFSKVSNWSLRNYLLTSCQQKMTEPINDVTCKEKFPISVTAWRNAQPKGQED